MRTLIVRLDHASARQARRGPEIVELRDRLPRPVRPQPVPSVMPPFTPPRLLVVTPRAERAPLYPAPPPLRQRQRHLYFIDSRQTAIPQAIPSRDAAVFYHSFVHRWSLTSHCIGWCLHTFTQSASNLLRIVHLIAQPHHQSYCY